MKFRKEFLVILTPLCFQLLISVAAYFVLLQVNKQLAEDHERKRIAIMLHEVEQVHGESLASAFFYGITDDYSLKVLHERSRSKLQSKVEKLESSIKAGSTLNIEKLRSSIDRSMGLQRELIHKNLLSLWEGVTYKNQPVSTYFLVDSIIIALTSDDQTVNHAFNPLDLPLDDFYLSDKFNASLSSAVNTMIVFLCVLGTLAIVLVAALILIVSRDFASRLKALRQKVLDVALDRKPDFALVYGDDQFAQLERRVEESTEKISELSQFKQYVLSTVSHDLKAPLTSITGFVTLSKQNKFGELKEDERKRVSLIESECIRVNNLISMILELERANSGFVEVEVDKFELSELFEVLETKLNEKIPGSSINFEGDFFEVFFEGDLDLTADAIFYLFEHMISRSKQENVIFTVRVLNESPDLIVSSDARFEAAGDDEDFFRELALKCAGQFLSRQKFSFKAVDSDTRTYEISLLASGSEPVDIHESAPYLDTGVLKEKVESQARVKPFFSIENKLILSVVIPSFVLLFLIANLVVVLNGTRQELTDEFRARQVLLCTSSITRNVANTIVTAVLESLTRREDLQEKRKSLFEEADKSLAFLKTLLPEPRKAYEKEIVDNLQAKIIRSRVASANLAKADKDEIVALSHMFNNKSSSIWKDAFGYVTEPLIKKYGLLESSSRASRNSIQKIENLLLLSLLVSFFATALSLLIVARGFTQRIEKLIENTDQLFEGDSYPEKLGGRDELALADTFFRECKTVIDEREKERVKLIQFLSEQLSAKLIEIRRLIKALLGKSNSLSEKGRLRFEVSVSEIQRMENLLNDFVDLDAFDRNAIVVRSEPVDLVKVAKQVAHAIKPQADLNSVLIEVSHSSDQLFAQADSERVVQIVFNLIQNAIKFSPSGSTVSVLVEQEEDSVKVSISDMGDGISSESQESIFDRFATLKERSGKGAGFGMGLYIVATLVALQHGRIDVQSEPGRGATFWFCLPLAG